MIDSGVGNWPDLPCYTSWDRLTFNTTRATWLRELQATLLGVSEPQPRQELHVRLVRPRGHGPRLRRILSGAGLGGQNRGDPAPAAR